MIQLRSHHRYRAHGVIEKPKRHVNSHNRRRALNVSPTHKHTLSSTRIPTNHARDGAEVLASRILKAVTS